MHGHLVGCFSFWLLQNQQVHCRCLSFCASSKRHTTNVMFSILSVSLKYILHLGRVFCGSFFFPQILGSWPSLLKKLRYLSMCWRPSFAQITGCLSLLSKNQPVVLMSVSGRRPRLLKTQPYQYTASSPPPPSCLAFCKTGDGWSLFGSEFW